MSECCTKNYIVCIMQKWRGKNPIFKLVIQIIGLSIFNAVILGIVYIKWYDGLSYVASLTAIITSAIVAICFVSYTYHRTNELRYFHALEGLITEMRSNNEKLANKKFNDQICKIQEKIGNQWVGFDKEPSFTDWSNSFGNFYLKYLPTTNYYYFIQQGFLNERISKEIEGGTKGSIAKIFGVYTAFNCLIQNYENSIKDKHVADLNSIKFKDIYEGYRENACKMNFYENYNKFMEESNSVVETLEKLLQKI